MQLSIRLWTVFALVAASLSCISMSGCKTSAALARVPGMGWLSSNKKDAPPPLMANTDTNRTYPPPSTKAQPYVASSADTSAEKNYDGSMASYNSPSRDGSVDYPSTNYPEDQFDSQTPPNYKTGPYNTGSAAAVPLSNQYRRDDSSAAGPQSGPYGADLRGSTSNDFDNGQDRPWQSNPSSYRQDVGRYGRSPSNGSVYRGAGNESAPMDTRADASAAYGRDAPSDRFDATPYAADPSSADNGYGEPIRSRDSGNFGDAAGADWPREDRRGRFDQRMDAPQGAGSTEAADARDHSGYVDRDRTSSTTARRDGDSARAGESWRPGSTTDYVANTPENRESTRGFDPTSQQRPDAYAQRGYDSIGRYDTPPRGDAAQDPRYGAEQRAPSVGYGNDSPDRYPQRLSRGADSPSRY